MKKIIAIIIIVVLFVIGCAPQSPVLCEENIELGKKALLMAKQTLNGNMSGSDTSSVILSYYNQIVEESQDDVDAAVAQIKFDTAMLVLSNYLLVGNDSKIKENYNNIADLVGEDHYKD